MKINVVTLGCSKNTVDSEVLMHFLQRGGWNVVINSNDTSAKVVVINTCGFIGDAKEESVNTILSFVDAKLKGVIDHIYVIGCLAQRYREDLIKEIPEVDGFYGVSQLPQVLEALKTEFIPSCQHQRLISTPKHYAYLKISEGCNWMCSYCAIPLIRGRHKSRSIESLIEETKFLVEQGVKEILVIAQDSTYYGIDLYGERKLAELLTKISEVDGVEWIRLHYAYPADFPEDVLDVIANNPKVCKYIDIPFQHISSSVLEAMHRRINAEKSIALVNKMRERIPEIAIRTTLLVGFPGETESDFKQLLDFIGDYKLDRVGVFPYSEEDGTFAAGLSDDVPSEEKQRRIDEIMQLQQQISLNNNLLKVGRVMRVIVDTVDSDCFVARTEFDSPEVDQEVIVNFQGSPRVKPGDFIDVKIIEAQDYDLIAEIAE